ncbi:MAG: ATPase [Thermodesulfobacteriota bacterium]
MMVGDFGTSYAKIWDLAVPGREPTVLPNRELAADLTVEVATGHSARRYGRRVVNELVALARGGEALIGRPSFLLVDCGSRDIKYVRFQDGQVQDMGWNAECGASLGFSIELLASYYHVDFRRLAAPREHFPVTCGVLGMSQIFDAIINGLPEEQAVARYVRGIALNAYRFAGSPEEIFLSGGLCDNPVFVASLPCRVVPLGRFVLLTGLARLATPEASTAGKAGAAG